MLETGDDDDAVLIQFLLDTFLLDLLDPGI